MSHCRKRKGGIKLDDSDDSGDDASIDSETGGNTGIEEGDKEKEADIPKTEKNEKSRVDDLWASFKKGVSGPVSSSSSGSSTSQGGSAGSASISGSSRGSVSRGGGSISDGSKGKVHFASPSSSCVCHTSRYMYLYLTSFSHCQGTDTILLSCDCLCVGK